MHWTTSISGIDQRRDWPYVQVSYSMTTHVLCTGKEVKHPVRQNKNSSLHFLQNRSSFLRSGVIRCLNLPLGREPEEVQEGKVAH